MIDSQSDHSQPKMERKGEGEEGEGRESEREWERKGGRRGIWRESERKKERTMSFIYLSI